MRTVPQIRAGVPADSPYVVPQWRKDTTRNMYMRWQFEALSNGDKATADHYTTKLAEMDAQPVASPANVEREYIRPISEADKNQIRDWMKRGFGQADARRWTGDIYTKGQISSFYFRERQRKARIAA